MTLLQERPLEQADVAPGEDDFHYVCPICWINDTGDGPRNGAEYVITACGITLDTTDYSEQENAAHDCAACDATLIVRGAFPCGHTADEVLGWIDARNLA